MKPQIACEHEFEAHGTGCLKSSLRVSASSGKARRIGQVIARRVFHVDKVAIYLCPRWPGVLQAPCPTRKACPRWLVPFFALGLGLLAVMGWWTARSTAYTLTNKRIVMRIGIVLTVAYNLPLKRIESADLHDAGSSCQDIALTLERGTRSPGCTCGRTPGRARGKHAADAARAARCARGGGAAGHAWSEANGAAVRPNLRCELPRAATARRPPGMRPPLVAQYRDPRLASRRHACPLPRLALIVAVAVLALTFAGDRVATLVGLRRPAAGRADDRAPRAALSGSPDGGIVILDATSGESLDTVRAELGFCAARCAPSCANAASAAGQRVLRFS